MQSAPSSGPAHPTLVVAGVSGGVGTSAVAVCLGAADARVFVGRPADVLVCRTTAESLIRASRAVAILGQGPGAVAVAVAVNTLDGARPNRPVTARMRILESTTATVVLPFVPALLASPDPLAALQSALRSPDSDLGKPMRRFVTAVRQLAQIVDQPIRPAPIGTAAKPLQHRQNRLVR
jgi:hypothetical protein